MDENEVREQELHDRRMARKEAEREELERLKLWERLAHDCIAAVREAYPPGEVGDTDAPQAIRRLIARVNAARPEAPQKPEAVDEFRCALSTIASLAKANGSNALHEISCTALAGIERLKLMAEETTPSPLARSQEKT